MLWMRLGASLYVPATRRDLAAVANRQKYPALRSVILDTEDSVRVDELPAALRNLEFCLRRLERCDLLRFVRVRDPGTLRRILCMTGVERLNGFVLPKITVHNLDEYMDLLPPGPLQVMPTLETVETFDLAEMTALRRRLLLPIYRDRVLSLRIGGNDLLNLLGIRRPCDRTLYRTPLGLTIAQLVTVFRPFGFNLTAPVFEWLDCPGLLARETRTDLAQGLFGKTAIHPDQVPLIESQYRVHARDLEAAQQILDVSSPAVFRLHGAMCEPTTHHRWASQIIERARLYGVIGATQKPHVAPRKQRTEGVAPLEK